MLIKFWFLSQINNLNTLIYEIIMKQKEQTEEADEGLRNEISCSPKLAYRAIGRCPMGALIPSLTGQVPDLAFPKL